MSYKEVFDNYSNYKNSRKNLEGDFDNLPRVYDCIVFIHISTHLLARDLILAFLNNISPYSLFKRDHNYIIC